MARKKVPITLPSVDDLFTSQGERDGSAIGGVSDIPLAAIDSVPHETDELTAVLPEGHPLARLDAVPLEAFLDEPFLALEHGADTEVAELFEQAGVGPDVALTTWDDYAIMAMVEKGLGLAILPGLILQRVPYRVAARPLVPRAHRSFVFATKAGVGRTLAVQRFREYLL